MPSAKSRTPPVRARSASTSWKPYIGSSASTCNTSSAVLPLRKSCISSESAVLVLYLSFIGTGPWYRRLNATSSDRITGSADRAASKQDEGAIRTAARGGQHQI